MGVCAGVVGRMLLIVLPVMIRLGLSSVLLVGLVSLSTMEHVLCVLCHAWYALLLHRVASAR